MTPEDVKKRVDEIRSASGDDEVAHSLEDMLHYDVLDAIAKGDASSAARCAREALKTREIEFARWCA